MAPMCVAFLGHLRIAVLLHFNLARYYSNCVAGTKVGNSESVDSDSISRLDSSLDSSPLQLAIYT